MLRCHGNTFFLQSHTGGSGKWGHVTRGSNKRFKCYHTHLIKQTLAHSEILSNDSLPGLPQSFPLPCVQTSPLNHQPLPSSLDGSSGGSSRGSWTSCSRTQNVLYLHPPQSGVSQVEILSGIWLLRFTLINFSNINKFSCETLYCVNDVMRTSSLFSSQRRKQYQ